MDLAWLVAVIEPDLLARRGYRDAGPLEPPAELAKAMQGRIQRSLFDEQIDDAAVRAAYAAIAGGDSALDKLIEVISASDTRDDLAKLTALTLLACALLAERDDVPTCLRLLDDALSWINDQSASTLLCRMLVLQQRALRNNDIGESVESDLDEIRRLIEQTRFDPYPELVLRVGADVTPEAAIDNILDVLRSSSAGFGLDLPSFDMGYVTSDLEDHQIGSYRRWLDSNYKTKISREVPTDYGPDLYFENLRLEVIGHREVYRARRELATMRVVRFIPSLPAAVAQDGLRLLRQAGADADLRQLIGELTFAGPMSAILADGRSIESNRTTDKALRTSEMIVLAAAAEVMSPSDAFKALTRVLSVIRRGGPTTAPLHWHADFSKDEDAWIAASALAAAAGTAGEIARSLLDYATPTRLTDEAFDRVVARIVARIDWEDVDGGLRALWLNLAATRTPDGRTTNTATAIRSALSVNAGVSLGADASLNDLAEGINHYLRTGIPIPDDVRQAAKDTALPSLVAAAKSAAAGTYGVGIVQPAEIVAVLLTQSPDDDEWAGLLDFLTNPVVARREKSRAFDVLVSEQPYLSTELGSRYADRLASIVTETDRWGFTDPYAGDVFVPALAFAYAYGFLADESVAQHFRALTSSPDAGRRGVAGRYLSLLASKSLQDWMLPMVFSLSTDADPKVRFAVTRALGQVAQRQDVLADLAIGHLSDFLQSGGVFVPLNTLDQLGPETLRAAEIDRIVRRLRNESQSWRVRKRAAELLG
jgi:HEAT repeat